MPQLFLKILMNTSLRLLLHHGSYIPLKRDHTAKIERKIISLVNSSIILKEIQRNFIPRDSNPPRLYGLPKVQKQNIPLRSIVNLIGYLT